MGREKKKTPSRTKMQTRKMASAFLQENDNNNKKKSTEQESDASMYKLLMVEKKNV